MKKFIIFAILLVFAVTTSNAGDLISLKIKFDPVVYEDADPEIVAKYTNQNPSFSVTGITYTFDLYSLESSELIYSKDVEGEDVEPGETVSINFGKLETGGLEYNNLYKGVITTEVDFDEDPSNNEGSFEFEYRSKFYNLELKLNELYSNNADLDINTPAYVHKEKVPAGTIIKSSYEDIFLKVNSESWVGWIDYEPNARFSHKTSLFTCDVETSEIEFILANWYPKIIWEDILDSNFTDDILIIGEEEQEINTETVETITSSVTPTKKDRVCALLVSGTDRNKPRLQMSFENDLQIVKSELMSEKLGPQLDESNIRIEKGIPNYEIKNILTSMENKYDQVYFYYSGHGIGATGSGKMCTGVGQSEWYSYNDFLKDLRKVGANYYYILIDACYSGLAKTELAKIPFGDASVTLITSSNDKKTARSNFFGPQNEIGFGLFTLNFMKCFGEPSADFDGTEGTTFIETFLWVKNQKPKDIKGRDLDSLQCATLSLGSKSEINKAEKSVSFQPGSDVKLLKVDSLEIDLGFYSIMNIDSKKYESSDKKIIDISGSRTWTLETDSKDDDFNVDVEFQLRDEFEMLTPELPNIIGMIWREDDTEDWQPQYPSIYNKDEKTITCPDVDHFSEWAVGIISANPTSVESKFLINNVDYGPNPFNNMLNFEFNLDKPESFSIEVVDITGRRVDFINTKDYSVGTFSVNLDGSKYPTGTYYCRLISKNGIRTIKLVKE